MRKCIAAIVTATLVLAQTLQVFAQQRQISYPAENPSSTSANAAPRALRIANGSFICATLGASTCANGTYSNINVGPGTGLYVTAAPGGNFGTGLLLQRQQEDPNPLPSAVPAGVPASPSPLPADTTLVAIPGVLQGTTAPYGPLTPPGTSGQSIYYLLEAQLAVGVDGTPIPALFVSQSGTRSFITVNSVRADNITFQLKAGTAGTSPTQPTTDSGWVAIAYILVPNGATQITSGMITAASAFTGFVQNATVVHVAPSPSPTPDIGNAGITGDFWANAFHSTVSTGTAPFTVNSSTAVVGLNTTGNAATATTLAACCLPQALGGNGNPSPGLTAGANIALSNAWPNQQVAVTSSLSGLTGVSSTTGTFSTSLTTAALTASGAITLSALTNQACLGTNSGGVVGAGSCPTVPAFNATSPLTVTSGSGTVTYACGTCVTNNTTNTYTTTAGDQILPPSGTATSSLNYGSVGAWKEQNSLWNGSAAVTNTWGTVADNVGNFVEQYNGATKATLSSSGAFTSNTVVGTNGPFLDFHIKDYGACAGGTQTTNMQAAYTAANTAASSLLNARVIFDCSVTIAGPLSPANNVVTDGHFQKLSIASGYNGNVFSYPSSGGTNIHAFNLLVNYAAAQTSGALFSIPSCYQCFVQNVVITGASGSVGPWDIFDLGSSGHNIVSSSFSNIRTDGGGNNGVVQHAAFNLLGTIENTTLCSNCVIYGTGSSGTATAILGNDSGITGGVPLSELVLTDTDFELFGTGLTVTQANNASTFSNIYMTNDTFDAPANGSINIAESNSAQSSQVYLTNPFITGTGTTNAISLTAGSNGIIGFHITGGKVGDGSGNAISVGANVNGVTLSGVDLNGNIAVASGALNVLVTGSNLEGFSPSINSGATNVQLVGNTQYPSTTIAGVTCRTIDWFETGSPFCRDTSGDIGMKGAVFSQKAANAIFSDTSGTTGAMWMQLANTAGSTYVGTESSAGGSIFTGSTGYASVIGSNTGEALDLATNGTVRVAIASGGAITATNSSGVLGNLGPAYTNASAALGGNFHHAFGTCTTATGTNPSCTITFSGAASPFTGIGTYACAISQDAGTLLPFGNVNTSGTVETITAIGTVVTGVTYLALCSGT